MNFLFKIKQQLLVTIFIFLTLILSFFLYFQFNKKKPIETIDYKAEADIVNPRFIKEKSKHWEPHCTTASLYLWKLVDGNIEW